METSLIQQSQSIISANDLLKTPPAQMEDSEAVLAYAFLSKFETKLLKKRIKELRDYVEKLSQKKGDKFDDDYVLTENNIAVKNSMRKGKVTYNLTALKALVSKKKKTLWWKEKFEELHIELISSEVVEKINEDGLRDAIANNLIDMEDIPKFTEIGEGSRVINIDVPEDFDKMFSNG